MSPERPLRVAVAQYAPVVGDLEGNRERAVGWVERAARAGAQLVVLPELASSGYVFSSEDEAAATAEVVADSPLVSSLAAACKRGGMHVVCGLNERCGDRRHNSAVVVGPGGLVGAYRKLHLFNDEQSWFAPGDDLPVFDLPFGRLGVVVCFDLWFPEPVRALALAGAEVVAVPTNWVASFKRRVFDERGWCQGNYVAVATAAQNGVVMACADRVGEERGVRFLGCSVIVDADGWPVQGPASSDGEELLFADVDLAGVERARCRTPRNHLLGDRLPEAYLRTPLKAGLPSDGGDPAAT